MENLAEIILTIIAMIVSGYSYFKFKESARRRGEAELRKLLVEMETKKMKEEISTSIKKARESRRAYEQSKKYFNDRFNTNKSDNK